MSDQPDQLEQAPQEIAAEETEQGAPEQRPLPPEPEQVPGIRWNDRVLVLGYTGSGKSELLNHLFGEFPVQRLLLDTKGHEFDVAGVEPVSQVEAIDWRQPIIHYVDRTGEVEEYQELFAACHRRRHLLVRVDELADVCEHQPNRAPTAFRQFCTKGRAHGQGLLGASQRPVNMPAAARTEAQHIFLFGPRLSPDDQKYIASTVGMSIEEVGRRIDALPRYGFLWWRRDTRELSDCPPLPEHLRAASPVRRRTVA